MLGLPAVTIRRQPFMNLTCSATVGTFLHGRMRKPPTLLTSLILVGAAQSPYIVAPLGTPRATIISASSRLVRYDSYSTSSMYASRLLLSASTRTTAVG